jgi:hypothetical protein
MKKFVERFPKIDQSQLLSDEQLNSIEGGACELACKKQCLTNMNGSDDDSLDVEADLGGLLAEEETEE